MWIWKLWKHFAKFITIIMLELHTVQILDQWLNFLRFCVNKIPQISRTFWRILGEYKMVVVVPLFLSQLLYHLTVALITLVLFLMHPLLQGLLLLACPIFSSILVLGRYHYYYHYCYYYYYHYHHHYYFVEKYV